MKQVKGWVVIDDKDQAIMRTLSLRTKKLSIWAFLKLQQAVGGTYIQYGEPINEKLVWRYYYNRGYRCIRVTLRADK